VQVRGRLGLVSTGKLGMWKMAANLLANLLAAAVQIGGILGVSMIGVAVVALEVEKLVCSCSCQS